MTDDSALLRDPLASLRGLLETSGELIWSIDLAGRWSYVNDAAARRIYGVPAEGIVGRPFVELVARELQERDTVVFGRVFEGEAVFDHETRHLRTDGEYIDLSFNAIARRDPAGRIVGAIGTARDVSERRRAAAALHENIERLRLAVETADLNYWEWDAASDTLQWGRKPEGAAERKTTWAGYAAAVHAEDRERYRAVGREAIASGEAFETEYRVATRDGRLLWYHARGVPMLNPAGRVFRMIGVSQDITARKRREDEVRFLAYHDLLTALPNRRLLDDRLQQALYAAQRHGRALAVLLIDLDDFKQVNDSAGHRAGDVVLREVAERLARCVRKSDTLARQGGDEFAIVLSDQRADADCGVVADKVLRAFAQPFQVEERAFTLGASVGIAVFPAGGTDGDSLLRNADAAMYRAKQLGKNQYRYHG